MEKLVDDLFKITEQTEAWSQEFQVLSLETELLSQLLYNSFNDQTIGRNLAKCK